MFCKHSKHVQKLHADNVFYITHLTSFHLCIFKEEARLHAMSPYMIVIFKNSPVWEVSAVQHMPGMLGKKLIFHSQNVLISRKKRLNMGGEPNALHTLSRGNTCFEYIQETGLLN